jgi:hypothetical protein
MITRLKWDDLKLLGFSDLKFKNGTAGMYSVSAKIITKVGKSSYCVNVNSQSRKTVSRVATITLACQAILDSYNMFLGLSHKEKLSYLEETGSKLYDGDN